MIEFHYLIALAFMLVASYTDIRTREVPDLLNYGLIILAVFARLIFGLFASDPSILIEGLIGGIIGFGIGAVMYYSGQWGGGDTKLLAGLGVLIGVPFRLEMSFFLIFLINILFAGAAYAFVLAIIAAVRHRKAFMKEASKISLGLRKVKLAFLASLLLIFALIFWSDDAYIRLMLYTLSILLFVMLYVYIFVKSVERTAMIKQYSVSKLTEGDWLAKDVYAGKKLLCGTKDLGITMQKINLLKKHGIKTVLVKEGIPFVPSFLIAFLLTYYAGNWILAFL